MNRQSSVRRFLLRNVMVLALLFAVGGASLVGCVLFGGRTNEHLLKEGTRARAVIVAIDETGTTINNRPLCKITLRVEPHDGDAYETTVQEAIALTLLPQLQPGSSVTVRYDPKDRREVIIEALGEAPSISAEDAKRMATESQALLEALNAQGAGVAANAVVLRFDPTGVKVNGDNALAVISVKVLPSDGPAYDAQIVGVFMKAGLGKYAPGKEIHVRFDPANRQRVTFDLEKTRSQMSE